jgi:hypothetical protein
MPKENEITDPRKIERSTVTKLVIAGAPLLEQITVFLEDLGGATALPTGANPNDQTDQVRLVGNSACPDEAQAWVRVNAADIVGEYAQAWLSGREIEEGTHFNYKSALNLCWMPHLALTA